MAEIEEIEFLIKECKRLIVIQNLTIFFYAPLNQTGEVNIDNSVYACKIDGYDRLLVMNIIGRWRELNVKMVNAFEVANELKNRLKNKSK